MALEQTSQDSPLTPTPESLEFLSGSKWDLVQLENLAFPLEAQVHDFAGLGKSYEGKPRLKTGN